MKAPQKKEKKKPKTAPDKGKRYRCASCWKRSPKKVKKAPWYCPSCLKLTSKERSDLGQEKRKRSERV